LGERLVRNEEVVSSILIGSTTLDLRMISLAHFFEDRPMIVAWAVIILFVDATWNMISGIYHSGFLVILFYPFMYYLLGMIADGKPGSRINFLIYNSFSVILGSIVFIAIISHWNFRGLFYFVGPKTVAYAMLYSPSSNAWFDAGGGTPGAKTVHSLDDTLGKDPTKPG
jgi:hypothetical protein